MRVGDYVQLCKEPWSPYAGDFVIITKIDEDGKGFDFIIPESRGHAPAHFIDHTLTNFDLEKLGIKP